jgi:hypothetical protein
VIGGLVIEKHNPEIEELLRRYRPAEPPSDLCDQISKFPHFQISKSPRTWPWAVAAAALLAMTVGLHAGTFGRLEDEYPVDERRVQAVADDLGGPQSRVMAQWIVLQEARADRETLLARAAQVDLGSPR